MSDMPVFSFILPANNEEENLPIMAERLLAVGQSLREPFEIIWVNDGSVDNTGDVLDALAQRFSEIVPVHLSRNFGHMAALSAGLEIAQATGAVVCLDSDGQHPPELIPELIKHWRQGAEIVQATRLHTADETFLKVLTSKLFYFIINYLGDIHIPDGSADFRLLDRQVLDVINSLPETDRFFRGLVQWVGFKQALCPYNAPARMKGRTKYNFIRMLRFAISGITSFTIRPLRISIIFGSLILLVASLYALYIFACLMFHKPLVMGWASLLMVTMILNGVLMIMLGITSEYIGKLYMEIKRRPVYIINKKRYIKHHDD